MRLRVTLELMPVGREVGRFEVFNSGEGENNHCHYAVEGYDGGRALRRASIGLLKRNATAPMSLAAHALKALGYIVPETPRDNDLGRCEARFRDFVARELSMSDADIEAAVAEVFGKVNRT